MKFDAVIVAAGSASRMGRDKLLLPLGEEAVLLRTTELFCRHLDVQKTIVVCRPDQRGAFRSLLASYPSVILVDGGATRHLSVKNGLREVSAEGVLIHDGARPFLSRDLIDRVMEGVRHHGAATPAAPVPDAVRVRKDGFVTAIAERDALCRVATPQGFVSAELKDAFERVPLAEYQDETAVYLACGESVYIIKDEIRNTKITDEGTYFGINALVGYGYDLHRLAPFRKLVIGGVEIASDFGAVAHSDGDCLVHALIDALLSAAGMPDIGTLFPDTDPRYRDIDSTILLSEVVRRLRDSNFKIHNVAATVMLERPKLAHDIPMMRVKLANLLGISSDRIAIAAKTGEGLPPVGTGEAIASVVAVTLI